MSTTHISLTKSQVLIVGAGPTGLVLAARLLAYGIEPMIIEKREQPEQHSRALGVHARTLELLDTMDLAEAFVDEGHRVPHLCLYAGPRRLVDLDFSRNGSPFGFVLHLPQNRTEALLRARVRELGGTIQQGVELLRLVDLGTHVCATVRDTTGRETEVRAGFVVGCDGAHSRVRHELDLGFEGEAYPQDWILADVALDGAGRDDAVHLFFHPTGTPLGCIPMGQGRWRVVMANAGHRNGRAPTLAEIQQQASARAPWPITVSDPEWLATFRCHRRTVREYRRGRVFLAGDAAHIHSPAGGQGMNTGMQDAHNLAEKLALVSWGRDPESLLDRYGQERLPAACSVIKVSDRLVRLMTLRHPVQRAMRDAALPILLGLPPLHRRVVRRLSQTAVARGGDPAERPATLQAAMPYQSAVIR